MIVALVDTLEYLKKGGRISKTVAFAGTVLNIKPVLSVVDGEINMLGKARGSKMGNNLLVQEIDKAGGIDFSKPVLLGIAVFLMRCFRNISKTAAIFGKAILRKFGIPQLAV